MTTDVIMDVVIAAVLAAFLIFGACRGLLRSLAGLAVFILALAGANLAAQTLTPPVTEFLRPVIEQRVEQRFDNALSEHGGIAPEEPSLDGDSRPAEEDGGMTRVEAASLLRLMGLDEKLAESLTGRVEEKMRDTGVSIAAAVIQSLAESLVHALLFLVSFIVLTVALNLLLKAMDLVLKLPGLHMANMVGGAAIGLVEGALAIFLAIWVLRCLGVLPDAKVVEQTHLLQFFMTHGPLDLLLI